VLPRTGISPDNGRRTLALRCRPTPGARSRWWRRCSPSGREAGASIRRRCP